MPSKAACDWDRLCDRLGVLLFSETSTTAQFVQHNAQLERAWEGMSDFERDERAQIRAITPPEGGEK